MQHIAFAGPIPQGQYTIGAAFNHSVRGPNVMTLTPVGHNALGRDDFMIHGNNATNNASQGCIILGPTLRQQIINSGDNSLIVQQ